MSSGLKDKDKCHWEIELTDEQLKQLEGFSKNIIDNFFKKQKNHVRNWIYSVCNITYLPY